MKVYAALFFLLLHCIGLQAQTLNNKQRTAAIVSSLNAKDGKGLLAMLADTCRIGNLPPMDNEKVIPEIVSKFNAIILYEIKEDSIYSNGNNLISLSVKYQDGKSGTPTFLFNKDGLLINLGIIKARMKGDPDKALATALKTTVKLDTVRIKFKMDNGLIYVPAVLNGLNGYFMFDSGAPVVILRKKYVPDSLISKDVSVDFTGMGGMMEDIKWAVGNTLEWTGFKLESLDAPVAEMDDMDLGEDRPIFGLMGYGMLAGYQLTFDYARQELLLEHVDEHGQLIGDSFKKGKIFERFPMRMKRHIPIVDISFGTQSYPMGIDCGANTNLFNTTLAEEITSYIDYEEQERSLLGVGGVEQNNRVGFVRQGKIGNRLLHDMYTVFSDQPIGGGSGKDALPVVGLLGAPFLAQQQVTLNFNKGEILFY